MNTEARELKLYAENESALYPQKQAIEKNLAIKAFKGVFDVKKAAKLWGLRTAISMVDLTTLEGKDTPGKVASRLNNWAPANRHEPSAAVA